MVPVSTRRPVGGGDHGLPDSGAFTMSPVRTAIRDTRKTDWYGMPGPGMHGET